ncbi:hypothetical protein [Aequorivita marisscotiae]|uniref:DUF7793 domain-containing protein n=1 Tax=Aequorivita marisscotiae TaxID=3040348 RepID=A0ABY8KRU7_9FLAO|nr:hypothetical protein [Aequorivita sp. Ant34-E75]WGF92176.1 hypothetical protein QCQ61_13305 [Aequorivita sp. Ant34-E75]
MERVHETNFCKFWTDGDILFVIYKPIPYLNIDIAKNIVASRLQFQEGKREAIFCDTRGIMDSSKMARDYLALEGSVLTRRIAIFDDRNIAKVMLKYYLFRNVPLVPTAVFTDRDKAIIFLKINQ